MIKLIAAVSKNGVIGKDNDLVLKDTEDMKHFMRTTKGNAVVMGRKTWESIPKAFRPMKDRANFIATKSTEIFESSMVGATILRDLNEVVWRRLASEMKKDIFVIGGGEIYKQTIDFADELIISEFNIEVEGDTYFPPIDLSIWEVVKEEPKTNFTIKTYARKDK